MPADTARTAIEIHHFSDILCIWAYVADIRIEELQAKFGDEIRLDFRTLPVFGNVPGKMQAQWADRGGVRGYAAHVHEIAQRFGHVALSPDVWVRNTPQSSLPAHLYLCAVKMAIRNGLVAADAYTRLARRLRHAFFVEVQDVSQAPVLRALLADCVDDVAAVLALIDDGRAFAQLADDMQLAKEQDVRSSPTLLFNEGRQRLAGNVGYRIIDANIRELIEQPQAQHSWC